MNNLLTFWKSDIFQIQQSLFGGYDPLFLSVIILFIATMLMQRLEATEYFNNPNMHVLIFLSEDKNRQIKAKCRHLISLGGQKCEDGEGNISGSSQPPMPRSLSDINPLHPTEILSATENIKKYFQFIPLKNSSIFINICFGIFYPDFSHTLFPRQIPVSCQLGLFTLVFYLLKTIMDMFFHIN